MNYVEKLLKSRKSAAELELSYCDLGTPEYNESKKKREDEIYQIEQALLILSPVIDCKHENEKMHQGDGFVYVTCTHCGEDL